MKKSLIYLSGVCAFTFSHAQITNPINYYRSLGAGSPALIKWEADLNGDGKNEVFILKKEAYDQDIAANQIPGWFVFVAASTPNNFSRPVGTRDAGDTVIGVGVLPAIDLNRCYIGMITEIGVRGVVTMKIDNPRAGDPIARIYAYTIEGDHLKGKKLAEYNAKQSNALFDKYLKDGKRTIITPVQVTQ